MGKTSHHKTVQTTATSNSSSASESQSVEFIKHVHEFRSRIFWVALLFIVSSALAYQYREILVDLVLSPLGDQKLIYLTPAGGFSFIFQITMYAGAVVTAPFFIYQLYKFVTPALPVRARKHAALIFITALMLMCSGVAFGYFVAVPSALAFLTTFAGGYVDASLTADSYLNFILAYVAGLGLLFQLPLLLIFWHWIKPLSPKQLMNSERFMIIFAFIAAAVITPTPDVVNQVLIAGPILIIYQMGVVAILIMTAKERKRARRLAKSGKGREVAAPTVHILQHPSLVMPSIEDLAPQKKIQTAPVHQKVRPVSIVKPAPIVAPTLKPVVVQAPKAMFVPTPPIIKSAPAPVRAHRGATVTYRARSTSLSRPLPMMSRQRPVSLDGFVVST